MLVEVTLLRAGARVAIRRVSAQVRAGSTNVTVLMTRDCEGIVCDSGSCVAGQCVDERCTVETPEFCNEPECSDEVPCQASGLACGVARCNEGVCFDEADDLLCAPGERCSGGSGCVERGSDAGAPDAGADAATRIRLHRSRPTNSRSFTTATGGSLIRIEPPSTNPLRTENPSRVFPGLTASRPWPPVRVRSSSSTGIQAG